MLTASDLKVQLIAVCKVIAVGTVALMGLCDDSSHFNGIVPEDDATLVQKGANRAYYTLTVLSTVGFGDISPKSKTCRFVTSILLLAVLVQFANFVSSS
jgi:hypothetical protein